MIKTAFLTLMLFVGLASAAGAQTLYPSVNFPSVNFDWLGDLPDAMAAARLRREQLRAARARAEREELELARAREELTRARQKEGRPATSPAQ
jgi:hypothetical protein